MGVYSNHRPGCPPESIIFWPGYDTRRLFSPRFSFPSACRGGRRSDALSDIRLKSFILLVLAALTLWDLFRAHALQGGAGQDGSYIALWSVIGYLLLSIILSSIYATSRPELAPTFVLIFWDWSRIILLLLSHFVYAYEFLVGGSIVVISLSNNAVSCGLDESTLQTISNTHAITLGSLFVFFFLSSYRFLDFVGAVTFFFAAVLALNQLQLIIPNITPCGIAVLGLKFSNTEAWETQFILYALSMAAIAYLFWGIIQIFRDIFASFQHGFRYAQFTMNPGTVCGTWVCSQRIPCGGDTEMFSSEKSTFTFGLFSGVDLDVHLRSSYKDINHICEMCSKETVCEAMRTLAMDKYLYPVQFADDAIAYPFSGIRALLVRFVQCWGLYDCFFWRDDGGKWVTKNASAAAEANSYALDLMSDVLESTGMNSLGSHGRSSNGLTGFAVRKNREKMMESLTDSEEFRKKPRRGSLVHWNGSAKPSQDSGIEYVSEESESMSREENGFSESKKRKYGGVTSKYSMASFPSQSQIINGVPPTGSAASSNDYSSNVPLSPVQSGVAPLSRGSSGDARNQNIYSDLDTQNSDSDFDSECTDVQSVDPNTPVIHYGSVQNVPKNRRGSTIVGSSPSVHSNNNNNNSNNNNIVHSNSLNNTSAAVPVVQSMSPPVATSSLGPTNTSNQASGNKWLALSSKGSAGKVAVAGIDVNRNVSPSNRSPVVIQKESEDDVVNGLYSNSNFNGISGYNSSNRPNGNNSPVLSSPPNRGPHAISQLQNPSVQSPGFSNASPLNANYMTKNGAINGSINVRIEPPTRSPVLSSFASNNNSSVTPMRESKAGDEDETVPSSRAQHLDPHQQAIVPVYNGNYNPYSPGNHQNPNGMISPNQYTQYSISNSRGSGYSLNSGFSPSDPLQNAINVRQVQAQREIDIRNQQQVRRTSSNSSMKRMKQLEQERLERLEEEMEQKERLRIEQEIIERRRKEMQQQLHLHQQQQQQQQQQLQLQLQQQQYQQQLQLQQHQQLQMQQQQQQEQELAMQLQIQQNQQHLQMQEEMLRNQSRQLQAAQSFVAPKANPSKLKALTKLLIQQQQQQPPSAMVTGVPMMGMVNGVPMSVPVVVAQRPSPVPPPSATLMRKSTLPPGFQPMSRQNRRS